MLRAETPRANTPGRRVPLWIWNIVQISKEHFTLGRPSGTGSSDKPKNNARSSFSSTLYYPGTHAADAKNATMGLAVVARQFT